MDACAREFEEDAEKFVKTAEELCGVYKWGRYDALVLPSSFPFGGMENPNVRRGGGRRIPVAKRSFSLLSADNRLRCSQMTFLTPALIVGDRSQVDVLAHVRLAVPSSSFPLTFTTPFYLLTLAPVVLNRKRRTAGMVTMSALRRGTRSGS